MKGGKVIVTRRPCDMQRAEQRAGLTNHRHEHIRLVKELPKYEELRRSKLVTYRLLDGVREQWLQANH